MQHLALAIRRLRLSPEAPRPIPVRAPTRVSALPSPLPLPSFARPMVAHDIRSTLHLLPPHPIPHPLSGRRLSLFTSSHSTSNRSITNPSLPPFPTTLAPAIITLFSAPMVASVSLHRSQLPQVVVAADLPYQKHLGRVVYRPSLSSRSHTAANALFDRLINAHVRDARPRTRGVSSRLATSHPPLHCLSGLPHPHPPACLARTSHRRDSLPNRSLPLHLTHDRCIPSSISLVCSSPRPYIKFSLPSRPCYAPHLKPQ
jgi:hypothetical protein